MEEYWIVPKRVMDQKLTQMQINKEPPEAAEIVNIDVLTQKILNRKDISEWQKADMLAASLERFLALRPRGLGEAGNLATHLPKPAAIIRNRFDGQAEVMDVDKIDDSLEQSSGDTRRGLKRKAVLPDGPNKLKSVAIPDDLLTDDEDPKLDQRGEKRKARAKRTPKRIKPDDSETILESDDPSPRGHKRKARTTGGLKKIRPLSTPEDLFTDDEDDKQEVRGEKRKAELDRIAKRVKAEQTEPEQERGQKRKANSNGGPRKKRPVAAPEDIFTDDEDEKRGIKRKATSKVPAKRKPTGMLWHNDNKGKFVSKNLKRKFEEVAEPDTILRKRSQYGFGASKWIYVY